MTGLRRLGILDFGGRRWGRPSWTAINETLRATQSAEAWGYSRYWLGEHQSLGDSWGTATLMIGHLAANTSRIRVGSAGVLVGHHDPFDVASDYRMLAALHPDRIDLGIAGGGPTMTALRNRTAGRDATASMLELLDFVRRRPEHLTPGEDPLIPLPADVTIDRPWLLGASSRSRDAAVLHRTAFCYSLFHTPRVDPDVVAGYLDGFTDGEPTAAICAMVICADTEREAQEIHARQRAAIDLRGATLNVLGSAAQCAEQLQELAHRYRVDEIIIHDVGRTVPERMRCYELLAAALLSAQPQMPSRMPPRIGGVSRTA